MNTESQSNRNRENKSSNSDSNNSSAGRFSSPLAVLIVLAALVIFSLAIFSLATIAQRSVAADEFSMAWTCKQDPALITGLYLSPRENNPPGAALALHYWGAVVGYSDVALRLFSTLFCFAAIAALWFMVDEWVRVMLVRTTGRHITPDDEQNTFFAKHRNTAFLLASTTPVLWMSANFARYQSLVLLLAFVALWAHLRWLRERQAVHISIYAACMAIMFYVHYLPAATLAVSAGLYVLTTLRGDMQKRFGEHSRKTILHWAAAQAAILLAIAPLVYWIVLAYRTIDLSGGRSSQLAAAPKFVAALLYGTLDGFVIPAWWAWVFVPSALAFGVLVVKALQSRLLLGWTAWWFVIFPFGFAALVMAKMYPAETVFLYPAIQKIAYLAPLAWIPLGMAAVRIQRQWLRNAVIACVVVCNVYAIAVWNLNAVAVQHTPPLREVAALVRSAGDSKQAVQAVVVHSFLYFYGPLGMGKHDGATTAVEHNLPEAASILFPETDVAPALTLDSARSLVEKYGKKYAAQRFWIVQRNRFPQNAQTLALALEQSGFRRASETPLQAQSSFDMWFKGQLLKRGIGGSADAKEAPQPFLYTAIEFVRESIQN
jgi:hypothetical protein